MQIQVGSTFIGIIFLKHTLIIHLEEDKFIIVRVQMPSVVEFGLFMDICQLTSR